MLPVKVSAFAHLETRVPASQLPEDITRWRDVVDSMEMSGRDHIVAL
jgi:hypothetical protein